MGHLKKEDLILGQFHNQCIPYDEKIYNLNYLLNKFEFDETEKKYITYIFNFCLGQT